MWHVGGPYSYFLREVDAFLVTSASPARGVRATEEEGDRLASSRVWDVLLRSLSLWFQTWTVYVNRVGFEDGVGFGGGSRVIDPFGERLGAPGGLDPESLRARLTSTALARARVETPLRRDEKPWIVAAELDALARRRPEADSE
jgi:predicted amidohydrolase